MHPELKQTTARPAYTQNKSGSFANGLMTAPRAAPNAVVRRNIDMMKD